MAAGHMNGAVTDEWLTPPGLIDALGPFDLDPCAPIKRPWPTARRHMTLKDDGLSSEWPRGDLVWLNPPYSRDTINQWLAKMAEHNNGIALVFARTETEAFFQQCWGRATCLLFLRGRLVFFDTSGKPGRFNGEAPSVLVGYGPTAFERMSAWRDLGAFVTTWSTSR